MKRTVLVLVATLAFAAAAVAQPAPIGPQWGQGPWAAPVQTQTVKVEGKLALVNGVIALQAGAKTYLVPRLSRIAGFVDGVKEGATVKVEGYEQPIPYAANTSMLAVTKLTVGGKDYDLGQYGPMYGWHGGMGMRGGRRW